MAGLFWRAGDDEVAAGLHLHQHHVAAGAGHPTCCRVLIGIAVADFQAGHRRVLEVTVADLRDAIAQEDEDKMRALSNDLQQLMMQISQSAYSEPQSQPAGGDDGKGGDEGVVEGEYTVE